ncbi:MAG: hypothetical protein ACD_16C00203G0004 [uncultured bacterium]|nr:MAG: hypothetical protein ACD_16C00203G0004 [uncultured bacterium]
MLLIAVMALGLGARSVGHWENDYTLESDTLGHTITKVTGHHWVDDPIFVVPVVGPSPAPVPDPEPRRAMCSARTNLSLMSLGGGAVLVGFGWWYMTSIPGADVTGRWMIGFGVPLACLGTLMCYPWESRRCMGLRRDPDQPAPRA